MIDVPFKYLSDPRIAGLVSGIETALFLAIAAFLINLATALAAAAHGQALAFDWRTNTFMLEASVVGAIGKGIAAYFGAKAAGATSPASEPPPSTPPQGAPTNG